MYPLNSQLGDAVAPPHAETDDRNRLMTFAVTTSSQDLDLVVGGSGTMPFLTRENHWVTFQPVGGDVYVRFKAATGGTTVTTGTGYKIADGAKEPFLIRHGRDTVVEIIGSAALTLRYWMSDGLGQKSPTAI